MDLRPSEISALIKEQIKNYDTSLEMNDVGYVIRVGDGIALIQGLQSAMAGDYPGHRLQRPRAEREQCLPAHRSIWNGIEP